MDTGIQPWACQNVLIHSHPGNCPQPSGTDEENFKQAFSHPHWAIMFIIAKGGNIYCRLKINIGPGVVKDLKVEIDWSVPFYGSDFEAWDKEYKDKVRVKKFRMTGKEGGITRSCLTNDHKDNPLWWNDKHEQCTLQQNELAMEFDEIDLGCYWDNSGCVVFFEEKQNSLYFYDPVERRWFTEDIFGETNGDTIEIKTPKESWATQVVAWAHEKIDGRTIAMTEESV